MERLKREQYVCLDVGGTEIKAACMDVYGGISSEIRYFPARADEDAGSILTHFADIVGKVRLPKTDLTGIRMAFPGPFDYENGISLMQGLGKYDKLYQVSVRAGLSDLLGVGEETILFINDAAAFALGEMGFGESRGAARALFICIGTGCGSAFGVDGKLAPAGTAGVPRSGYVYDAPYLEGCIDDYLSRRGLMALTRERMGTALDGRALAQRVSQGDEAARQCFLAFGMRISNALEPFLDAFHPEILCIGGQITGSSAMFLEPVEDACRERAVRLYVTQDTSLRTLQGLTRLYTGG